MTRKALSQFKTSTKVATADRVTARSTSSFTMAVAIAGQGGASIRFNIDPPVDGKSIWDLSADGALALRTAGTWNITPIAVFTGNVKIWGAGGGAGTASGGIGGGGGAAVATIQFESTKTYRLIVGATGVVGGGSFGSGGGGGTGIHDGTASV